MTRDWKKEGLEAIAANRAMQEAMWRANNAGKIRLYLVSSPDDQPTFTAEHQAELRKVITALCESEIEFDAPFMAVDSVYAHGGYVGELVLLVQAVGPALGVVVGAWLQSKAGRKVRLKDGDIEVEAQTVQEAGELLAMVEEYRAKRPAQIAAKPAIP